MLKKSKVRKRKRGKRSRNKNSKISVTENLSLTLIAPRTKLAFKWYDIGTFSLATVTASSQRFNLNSLFEPITGNAHQPMGYDQVDVFYNRYRVERTRWHVNFLTSSTDYYGCALPSNDAVNTLPTTQATFQTMTEYQRSKAVAVSSNAPTKSIIGSLRLHELLGVREHEYTSSTTYSSAPGASPIELLYFYVCAYNPSGGTITINWDITLIFEAELYDPVQLPGS